MHPIIQKTREDYNLIAPFFSDTRRHLWRELDQCKQYVKNGQRVLDWGCGNGRLVGLFADYSGIEYYGVDQSIELVKIARRAHSALVQQRKAHFYCTAKRQKKFSADFFDLEFLIASLHHLPDERTRLLLLQKMHHELKPGGRIIITVWNLSSEWANIKKHNGWTVLGTQDFLIPWKDPTGKILCDRYYHGFVQEELRALLAQAGFQVKHLSYSEGRWTDDKGGRNLLAIAKKI